MIASKEEESGKLAKEIKEDLIPHLRSSINIKAQTELREKLPHSRNIRAGVIISKHRCKKNCEYSWTTNKTLERQC